MEKEEVYKDNSPKKRYTKLYLILGWLENRGSLVSHEEPGGRDRKHHSLLVHQRSCLPPVYIFACPSPSYRTAPRGGPPDSRLCGHFASWCPVGKLALTSAWCFGWRGCQQLVGGDHNSCMSRQGGDVESLSFCPIDVPSTNAVVSSDGHVPSSILLFGCITGHVGQVRATGPIDAESAIIRAPLHSSAFVNAVLDATLPVAARHNFCVRM